MIDLINWKRKAIKRNQCNKISDLSALQSSCQLTAIDAKVCGGKHILDLAAVHPLIGYIDGEEQCIILHIFLSLISQPIEIVMIAGMISTIFILHLHHYDLASVADKQVL